MNDAFDDRRRGYEAKWVHDADLKFQIEAKRDRIVGLWAAEAKGLSGEAAEDFVSSVIVSDFQEAGDADVFRKLRAELDPATFPDAEIRARLDAALEEAVKALT